MSNQAPFAIKNPLAVQPSNSPKFKVDLKLASGDEISLADPRSTRAMVALMDMAAVIGGAASHWGGPAAFAEIMSSIYGYSFWQAQKEGRPYYDLFHLVNDAGHCENGIYALKANYGYADLNLDSLKGFRSMQSPLAGHGEVHLFRQGVYIANGPLGSGLPQAQGLAMADAHEGKDRVTVVTISDGASFEGEARESFAAIPGFAAKGQLAPFVCVISDNNTKLSGRIDEQSFSMNETFAALPALGWEVIELPEGNNLGACLATFEKACELAKANPKKPVAIHAKTVKGFGVKATEESASGGHGFPLKGPAELTAFVSEIYGGEEVPAEFTAWIDEMVAEVAQKKSGGAKDENNPSEKVQLGVSQALIEKRKAGLPIISISSDLPGSTGTAGFQKAHPEATYDVGVAEANMVSAAIGFSKSGFIPVVDTFSAFGVTKGSLPMIMSSLSEAPIFAVYSHTGFQDAADGASHQSLTYFSMMSSIPNVDVHCLTSSEEAYHLVSQALDQFAEDRKAGKTPRSQVFFLGRENFPRRQLAETYNYQLGKAQVVLETAGSGDKKVAIAAAGPLLPQAKLAAEKLAEKGIASVVVNPSVINHPDVETFRQVLAKTDGNLLTVEDHQLIGGMGALLTHALLQDGVKFQSRSLGVDGEFGRSAYTALQLYQKHGLDSESIVSTVEGWI